MSATAVSMQTVYCREPGCAEEAPSTRGLYAYLCTRHSQQRAEQRREGAGMRVTVADGSFEQRAKTLIQSGKQVDRARAAYEKARMELDAAMRAWKQATDDVAPPISE